MELYNRADALRRVAMIGNHTPRQCGLATFTADLTGAVAARYSSMDCFTVAMNDRTEGYDYPAQVRCEIEADSLPSYRKAAHFLNTGDVDVVCLQHEYGIFGGNAGSHILSLLRDLRMPVVTTLHTILREPNVDQYQVMAELLRLSDRVVVMSQQGARFLRDVHGVDKAKIDLIHHGIPEVSAAEPEHSKQQFKVGGKFVMLTFGLLSPDKGIENVIEALPAIVERFPDVVYIVLGATHPHVRAHRGEAYRESLEALAERLGVRENIHFHNHFVPLEELTRYLRAADIYITPYLKKEQITSGTLAYAVGSGKAVISTPYYYAEELLAENRGILVPWCDPAAIAREVIALRSDTKKLTALQQRASEFGRQMVWPAVAERYRESFLQARTERARRTYRTSLERRPITSLAELPALNLAHLQMMTDDTGLLQHATHNIPNYDEGYCVDDNARALMLTTHIEANEKELDVRLPATRYMAFVRHAFNPEKGYFRNFLSYDRRWLEERGSEDSHARTLWALGTVVGRSSDPGRRSSAESLFREALPVVEKFTSPRSWAYTLLGLEEFFHRAESGVADEIYSLLAWRLFRQFEENGTPDWPWLENSVTYANARLPQSLLLAGRRLKQDAMFTMGIRSLTWLAEVQSSRDGDFAPIGSEGFLQRGDFAAQFDQQPIEACGMVSACLLAARLTGDAKWHKEARRAFDWFLGRNPHGVSLYDPTSGSCCDGLHPDRANANQGAESTLSFLQALVEMRNAVRQSRVPVSRQRIRLPEMPGVFLTGERVSIRDRRSSITGT